MSDAARPALADASSDAHFASDPAAAGIPASPASPLVPVVPQAGPTPAASDPPTKSQVRAAARRRARFGRRLAAAVWKDPFRVLPVDRPLVRFLRGFLLPIALLRGTLGDPDRRRQWFKVTAIQVLVVVTIGGAIGFRATVEDIQTHAFGENGKVTIDLGGLTIFVALAYVEWCVIALSRQYHDAISRNASIAVGVPPEDPPVAPRVALDFRWVMNKAKRRWRSFKAWLGGVPPLLFLAIIPWAGDILFQVFLAAWTLFWIACGVSAKTAYAWRSESDLAAREPHYLNRASRFTTEVPIFRWWAPRLYLRIWRWLTRGLYPPVREVEDRRFEFAGLALARIVLGLPVIYLLVRPFFPVAAADVILRGLAAPRGKGARDSRPSLAALAAPAGPKELVVSPSSPEAEAVEAHRQDKED